MLEQPDHATTDYFIAVGLHLADELPLEEVHRYWMGTSDRASLHAAQVCSNVLLAGLTSGMLEPWQPIFKAKSSIIERWPVFWAERGVKTPPYLAALFFSRFQSRSPLPGEPADHLIFLKIKGRTIENIEEFVRHLIETEGKRAPEGVFAINTLELSRTLRRRRKSTKGPE